MVPGVPKGSGCGGDSGLMALASTARIAFTARDLTKRRRAWLHIVGVASASSTQVQVPVRVCYYRTDDCIPMEVSGGERKEARLGSMPSVKEFGFEFREKF